MSSIIAPTRSDWTWRRIEQDGSVSANGLRHETMKACFAEVRDHKAKFGEAAITVNLLGQPSPTVVPPPSLAERSAPVLNQTLKKRVNRQIGLSR